MNGLDGRINCPSYVLSSFLDTFICTHHLQEKFEDIKELQWPTEKRTKTQIIVDET
jgi:hypothetical protein